MVTYPKPTAVRPDLIALDDAKAEAISRVQKIVLELLRDVIGRPLPPEISEYRARLVTAARAADAGTSTQVQNAILSLHAAESKETVPELIARVIARDTETTPKIVRANGLMDRAEAVIEGANSVAEVRTLFIAIKARLDELV